MINKYGNKKVTIDGISFDSKKEARYYLLLRQREKDGEISNLRLQVPYEIIPAVYRDEICVLKTKTKTVRRCVQRAVHYIADFVYTDKDGNECVVDVKGGHATMTKEFLLKKKLMLALLGIDVKII